MADLGGMSLHPSEVRISEIHSSELASKKIVRILSTHSTCCCSAAKSRPERGQVAVSRATVLYYMNLSGVNVANLAAYDVI